MGCPKDSRQPGGVWAAKAERCYRDSYALLRERGRREAPTERTR